MLKPGGIMIIINETTTGIAELRTLFATTCAAKEHIYSDKQVETALQLMKCPFYKECIPGAITLSPSLIDSMMYFFLLEEPHPEQHKQVTEFLRVKGESMRQDSTLFVVQKMMHHGD